MAARADSVSRGIKDLLCMVQLLLGLEKPDFNTCWFRSILPEHHWGWVSLASGIPPIVFRVPPCSLQKP